MNNQINIKDWDAFLKGHWQREMPSEEGMYLTADYTGNQCSYVILYRHPQTKELKCYPLWNGWYWSEPLPKMPQAPEFK